MSTKRAILIAAAAAWLTMPTMAAAPGTIKARQDNFKAMGRSMKMISDELKKDVPDFAVIRREAGALNKAGARIGKYFPKGTGSEAGIKTEALPTIWQQPAAFSSAVTNMKRATKGLGTAAAGTDAGKVRAAMGATLGTCKACHDKFRLDD